MINPHIEKAWERIACAMGLLMAIWGGIILGSGIYLVFKYIQAAKVLP